MFRLDLTVECIVSDAAGKNEDVSVRLHRRLESYDRPLPPPCMPALKARLLSPRELQDRARLQKTLQPHLRKMEQLAELYTLQTSEHGALDSQFTELLPHLYRTQSAGNKLKKTCGPQCSRAAQITLRYNEAKLNEGVRHQLSTNRANAHALLASSLQPLCADACHVFAALEACADQMCAQPDCADSGACMYFLLVETYGDQLGTYPPAKHLFAVCADKLAELFVAGHDKETARLCRMILEQGNKRNLILKHFCPKSVGTESFLQMYSDIVDKLGSVFFIFCNDIVL